MIKVTCKDKQPIPIYTYEQLKPGVLYKGIEENVKDRYDTVYIKAPNGCCVWFENGKIGSITSQTMGADRFIKAPEDVVVTLCNSEEE